MDNPRARLALLLVLFVGSGVLQPLSISRLGVLGAYERSSLLFLLPNYLGMSLAGFLHSDLFRIGTFRKGRLAVLCAIDVASQFLCQYGLTLAGSSLYSIVYSSATIWIAIESRLLLQRALSAGQWVGCLVVVGGLSIAGGNIGSALAADNADPYIAVGTLMILIGSMSHALTWVLVEITLHESDPVLPEALSVVMGCSGVGVFGLWQLVYTLPRLEELVLQPMAAHGGHLCEIAITYAVLVVASLVHAVAFYHLIGGIGCVTAGVMKGCQATAVFICSHLLFCSSQQSQCFTTAKAWSLVLVVVGTTTYALSKRHAESSQRATDLDAAADYIKL